MGPDGARAALAKAAVSRSPAKILSWLLNDLAHDLRNECGRVWLLVIIFHWDKISCVEFPARNMSTLGSNNVFVL